MRCAYCDKAISRAAASSGTKRFCSMRHWSLFMEKGAKVKVLAFGGAKQRLVKIICRCGCGTPFVEGKGVKVGRRWFVDLEHSRTFNQQLYQRKKASALRDRRPRLEPRQARIAPPEPETMWEFVDAFVRARDEQTDRELGKLKDAPA